MNRQIVLAIRADCLYVSVRMSVYICMRVVEAVRACVYAKRSTCVCALFSHERIVDRRSFSPRILGLNSNITLLYILLTSTA